MADPASSLTFVLDENWTGLPILLRQSRSLQCERVKTLVEVGVPAGALDPELLTIVGRLRRPVLLTRDGSMLDPRFQRDAWSASGVTLFLFHKKWGQLKLGEIARRFLYLWPDVVRRAEECAQGDAWRVAPTIPTAPTRTFRQISGRHAEA